MSNCQVGGIDFGKNTLNYNILYEDEQYLSLAFEKYFCCDADGTKSDLFIFNFDKTTGKQFNTWKAFATANPKKIITPGSK